MIDVPVQVYLVLVTTRSAHYDKKSIEFGTGRSGPKYKICGEIPPESATRAFFISTSEETGEKARYNITVQEREWINRKKGRLKGTSRFSPQRVEILDATAISTKILDAKNGFEKVAEMPEKKYKALLECFELFRRNESARLGTKSIERLDIAIGFDPVAELKKLGLR